MQELEQQANDDMFVIVSDVHLDQPQVLEKLREMFEGFSGMPHLPLFVLIGDFTSRPIGFGASRALLGGEIGLFHLLTISRMLQARTAFSSCWTTSGTSLTSSLSSRSWRRRVDSFLCPVPAIPELATPYRDHRCGLLLPPLSHSRSCSRGAPINYNFFSLNRAAPSWLRSLRATFKRRSHTRVSPRTRAGTSLFSLLLSFNTMGYIHRLMSTTACFLGCGSMRRRLLFIAKTS